MKLEDLIIGNFYYYKRNAKFYYLFRPGPMDTWWKGFELKDSPSW